MATTLKARAQSGAMLLEALIGILIFSTGILALIGMQAMAIGYASDAKYRADASFLANQIVAQMWVDRANLGNYVYDGTGAPPATLTNWVNAVEGALPGAVNNRPVVAANAGTGQVSVTIRWSPPNAEAVRNYHTTAMIINP